MIGAAWNEEKNGLEHLQTDLDEYMKEYNNERTHQGKGVRAEPPWESFLDGKRLFDQKNLND